MHIRLYSLIALYSSLQSFKKYLLNAFHLQMLYQPLYGKCAVLCLVAQSCLTHCSPMDCSPPGSSVHGDSLGKSTEVGCPSLLQWIFPTQGSNLGLPHCRGIVYQLSQQGSNIYPSIKIILNHFIYKRYPSNRYTKFYCLFCLVLWLFRWQFGLWFVSYLFCS